MVKISKSKSSLQKLKDQEAHITALKELIDFYKDITETIREPFLILDSKLKVVIANDAFYKKFKVLKNETEGKSIYNLGNNQWNSKDLREALDNILPKQHVINNYEFTNDFPVIGIRTLLLNARQVSSKQLIFLSMSDVSGVKRFRTDSAEITASLIMQRDRLQDLNEAKDEFIMVASHQLRTPATAVKQYTGMMLEGYAGKMSKTQMNMLRAAYKSNERQLSIIEELLRVARIDEGKIELCKSSYNIVKQIEDVIQDQFAATREQKMDITFNKPDRKIIVNADKKMMRMVLENLMDNAEKYSYDGGRIIIDVSQDNEQTSISIKDEGVGILKKDHDKLFQRFSRIDNPLTVSVNGTGLGLYWVKKVLDLHEGSMEVVSKYKQGSTFIIRLPNMYPL